MKTHKTKNSLRLGVVKKIILIVFLGGISMAARDPFEPTYLKQNPSQTFSLENFTLRSLQLKAILGGTKNNLALFETGTGETFIVKVGSKIGKKGGKVTKIDANIVLVKSSYGNVTFKLGSP